MAEEMGRLCERLATKLAKRPVRKPIVLCFDHFARVPDPVDVRDRLAHFVLEPHRYGISCSVPLLGVVHAYDFVAQGVYLNRTVAQRAGLPLSMLKRIARSVRLGYLTPLDGRYRCHFVS